jgi:hypothetical protein
VRIMRLTPSPSYSVADRRRDCEPERNASADGSAS